MAAQANIQANIAEVRGVVQQRLTARKSANPNSEEKRTANAELDADIARLDKLRTALHALVAAVPPPLPAAIPAVDLTDYVSIQAYIGRRKAENADIAFKQILAKIAAMVRQAKSADPNSPIQIRPATISEELWYYRQLGG
jgi:phage I-like protein